MARMLSLAPILIAAACSAPPSSDGLVWPNPQSYANSDPWLVKNHARISVIKPKLLVLNFANPSTREGVSTLVGRIVEGFEAASQPRGYERPGQTPQLQYQLIAIRDLRDGVDGRPAAPAGYKPRNSTLMPRRIPPSPDQWAFDYAKLFSRDFAPHLGFQDPHRPGRFLDLCAALDQGALNELWIVASQDVPDASMAEILEEVPRYDASGKRLPGEPERCAGNGCFGKEVPFCGRSIRIGFVNYNRGPGCYLHSIGHSVEGLARSGAIPALREWFLPFAAFDLDSKYGLPFHDLYGLDCPQRPCLSFPSSGSARFTFDGTDGKTHSRLVKPFDPVCGDVHYPPNGRQDYDYKDAAAVRTTCEGFGRHGGADGSDAAGPVEAADWARYKDFGDCGGEFMVWWYQNMPQYGSVQTFKDGRAMPSVWPFLYW